MGSLLKICEPGWNNTAARLIPWDGWIDVQRPAVNSACQRLRRFDALRSQPGRYVQAPLPVMAIADHVLVQIELLQIRRDGTHGNQRCAFDAASVVFPLLSNVH